MRAQNLNKNFSNVDILAFLARENLKVYYLQNKKTGKKTMHFETEFWFGCDESDIDKVPISTIIETAQSIWHRLDAKLLLGRLVRMERKAEVSDEDDEYIYKKLKWTKIIKILDLK